jgi:NAD(P)-dependent dehydrogenase (short-subunit alcohol dehydrogenase family)
MTEGMQASLTAEKAQQVVMNQLIKRSTQPEDTAAAVPFLASDEADAITGQTLAVNAGEYLH